MDTAERVEPFLRTMPNGCGSDAEVVEGAEAEEAAVAAGQLYSVTMGCDGGWTTGGAGG
jgi:hypothetical protein